MLLRLLYGRFWPTLFKWFDWYMCLKVVLDLSSSECGWVPKRSWLDPIQLFFRVGEGLMGQYFSTDSPGLTGAHGSKQQFLVE